MIKIRSEQNWKKQMSLYLVARAQTHNQKKKFRQNKIRFGSVVPSTILNYAFLSFIISWEKRPNCNYYQWPPFG